MSGMRAEVGLLELCWRVLRRGESLWESEVSFRGKFCGLINLSGVNEWLFLNDSSVLNITWIV